MFVYSLDGLQIDGELPEDQEIEDSEVTARAGVYHVLSRIFSLPTDDTYDIAVKGEWPQQLRDAAELLAFDFDFGVSALASSVSRSDYEAEYLRLFEIDPDGPAAPIFAGNYGEGARQARLEEVIRFFEYFGLKTAEDQKRPPDHLATELEFMQYLAFKEAASTSPRLGASYRRAQEDFLERQLVVWLPAFAEKVEHAQGLPIYVWAGQTARAFVEADLAYLRG